MKLGLNVGSGQRRFTTVPGEIEWINVDKISRSGHEPDLVADGAHLPYEDNSVDYFLLHHVLEHFGCGDGAGLIREAHRVLKADGSLIILVPDLRKLAERWLDRNLDTQIYVTNLYGAYMGDEEDRHKWGFDDLSLYYLLRDNPQFGAWIKIGLFDFREITGADIAHDWWILGMEATK